MNPTEPARASAGLIAGVSVSSLVGALPPGVATRDDPKAANEKETEMSFEIADESAKRIADELSPARRASEQIANRLADLNGLVSHLEKRLSPILRPEDTAASDRLNAVPNGGYSEHTAELRKHEDFAIEIGERLNSILTRLDI